MCVGVACCHERHLTALAATRSCPGLGAGPTATGRHAYHFSCRTARPLRPGRPSALSGHGLGIPDATGRAARLDAGAAGAVPVEWAGAGWGPGDAAGRGGSGSQRLFRRTPPPFQLLLYLEPGTVRVASPDSLANATVAGTPLNADAQRLRTALKPVNARQQQLTARARAVPPQPTSRRPPSRPRASSSSPPSRPSGGKS